MRKITSIIIVMLMLLTIISIVPYVSAEGTPVYVSADQDPEWYDETHVATIQEGIDNVSEGGTVYIWDGTYDGADVNKPVTILGNGTSSIVQNDALYIDSDNISISYLHFEENANIAGMGNDININNCFFSNDSNIDIEYWPNYYENLNISNNEFNNGPDVTAIFVYRYNYTTFYNNTINSCNEGILLGGCTNYEISYNNISDTFDSIDIGDEDSSNALIHNNIITNSGEYAIWGEPLYNGYIYSNVLSGSNAIISLEGDSEYNMIYSNYVDTIEIIDSTSNTIYNNYITSGAIDNTGENIWNISKTPGTNIVGGPYLGGNYWSNYAASVGGNWAEATLPASWSARNSFASVVFDNKTWVMGGQDADAFQHDVWYSTDGINWTEATANAGWSRRINFGLVVYDNKMWVLGGIDWGTLGPLNDTWYSTDGINWTRATAGANWSKRDSFATLVYDNRIWMMGGETTGGTYQHDVWYSTDGINWIEATASANWSRRKCASAIVFDNKMWIMGGIDWGILAPLNDTWYSTDGINWTRATASANWSTRSEFGAVVYDDKMWVMGGLHTASCLNDVWYSTDGGNWAEATSSASWSARNSFASVVYDIKIWVMGGLTQSLDKLNDVWQSITVSSYDTNGDYLGDINIPYTSDDNIVSGGDYLPLIDGYVPPGPSGGPTATLNVTLTPSAIADISCNQSIWNPACGIGDDEHTSTTWAKIENTGTIQVDIWITATDTDAWTLETAPDDNEFNMSYIIAGSYTTITTGNESFASDMAYDEEQAFGLAAFMPTSSSTNTPQVSTITFTASVD